MTGSTQVYVCHRIKDTAASTFFGNPVRKLAFLTLLGGPVGTFTYRQARRMWTAAADPTMADPKLWRGFFVPAQVSVPLTVGGEPEFIGHMWDRFIYTDGWTQNSNIELIDKSWICYGSSTNATQVNPGSMWVDIGPAGTTL
jgi:hypothetical protein